MVAVSLAISACGLRRLPTAVPSASAGQHGAPRWLWIGCDEQPPADPLGQLSYPVSLVESSAHWHPVCPEKDQREAVSRE